MFTVDDRIKFIEFLIASDTSIKKMMKNINQLIQHLKMLYIAISENSNIVEKCHIFQLEFHNLSYFLTIYGGMMVMFYF